MQLCPSPHDVLPQALSIVHYLPPVCYQRVGVGGHEEGEVYQIYTVMEGH